MYSLKQIENSQDKILEKTQVFWQIGNYNSVYSTQEKYLINICLFEETLVLNQKFVS